MQQAEASPAARRFPRLRGSASLAPRGQPDARPGELFMRERLHFLLLNVGHFLDHLFTLIFATVAALALHREWGLGYAELLKYATPGFFAFGVFALPAGWLADKWSREGMMSVFFIGIGARLHRHGVCAHALRDRARAVRGRRVRRHLPPGRPRHRRGEVEEHRHAHRRQRRVGQPGRCQRGADHRLLHRPRRLAHGLRRAGHRVDPDRHRLHRPDVAGADAAQAAREGDRLRRGRCRPTSRRC